MPFSLGVLGTAFSEATLVKLASAIEDLMISTDSDFQRPKIPPTWSGYLERNIPCYILEIQATLTNENFGWVVFVFDIGVSLIQRATDGITSYVRYRKVAKIA